MALGRIKRNAVKVAMTTKRRDGTRGGLERGFNVKVYVGPHQGGGYYAEACIAKPKTSAKNMKDVYRHFAQTCAVGHPGGRTPQSAVAHALKDLAVQVAKRDKKKRPYGTS